MKSNLSLIESIIDAVDISLEKNGHNKTEFKMKSVFVRKQSKWAPPEKMLELHSRRKYSKEELKTAEKDFTTWLDRVHCYPSQGINTGYGKGRKYGLELSMMDYDEGGRVTLFFPSNNGAKSVKVDVKKYKEHWTPEGEFKQVEYMGKRSKKPTKGSLFNHSKKIDCYAYLSGVFDDRTGMVHEFAAFQHLYLLGSNFKPEDAEIYQAYFDWQTEKTMGNIEWNSVGGLQEAKKIIEYSTILMEENNDIFADEERDHLLLVGPPGVGKTTLIRAMFTRLKGKANFIPYSIAAQVFGGHEDEPTIAFDMMLQHMNSLSEATGRWTYLFIDEIDNIAREGMQSKALLRNMDNSGERRFSIIASTNRPDVMDFALFRSGRFSPLVYVGAPNDKERYDIWEIILRRHNIDMNAKELADDSNGFTGADINHIVKMVDRESKYAMVMKKKFDIKRELRGQLRGQKDLFRMRNQNWEERVRNFISTVESNINGMYM